MTLRPVLPGVPAYFGYMLLVRVDRESIMITSQTMKALISQ